MYLSEEEIEKIKAKMRRLLESDPWLRGKVDRTRRLNELRLYVDKYIPEIKQRELQGFLDVGPGPGELIELAMSYSMDGYGWDAESPEGGMGDNYLQYSKLSHKVRGLDVIYDDDYYSSQVRFHRSLSVINSRGSIEQVLSSCMNGKPHDKHHDCRKLSWDLKRGREGLTRFLRAMRNSLMDNGILMIAANGAANTEWYDKTLMDLSDPCGFSRVKRFDERNHKFYV